MKVYKKDELKFKDGYLMTEDEVVAIDKHVCVLLDKLEVALQQADYLEGQPAFSPGPTLDGFKRKRSDKWTVEHKPQPVHEAKVEEAEAFMAEADEYQIELDLQKAVDRFRDLLNWCESDIVVEGDVLDKVDLPMLGNPLELTSERVLAELEHLVRIPAVDIEPYRRPIVDDGDLGPETMRKVAEWYLDPEAKAKFWAAEKSWMKKMAGVEENQVL